MKKLMTILVVFALCGVAMAAGPGSSNNRYDMSMDTERVTKEVTVPRKEISGYEYYRYLLSGNQNVVQEGNKYYYNEHTETQTVTEKIATTHDYTNALGKTGLEYTVTYNNGSVNGQNPASRYIGQLYFTTKDVTLQTGEVLAVQFMGTSDSDHGATPEQLANYDVTEYGIYLYDPDQAIDEREYMSIGAKKNYFAIGPDQDFGIYYRNKQGEIITSTENFVANQDGDPHEINVYSETVDGVTTDYPDGKTVWTNKHYMCMFEEEKSVWPHWEFMLQTTIDNPYYDVNPSEFEGNGSAEVPNTTSGQPLPGTLATILISGLCAKALSKKNKKH